jgi:hypothetical protein
MGSTRGGSSPSPRREWEPVASIYLFGYLEDDYLGRVIVARDELTVGQVAAQLSAWSYEHGAPVAATNEAGDQLDLQAPIHAVGLRNGDILTVRRRA